MLTFESILAVGRSIVRSKAEVNKPMIEDYLVELEDLELQKLQVGYSYWTRLLLSEIQLSGEEGVCCEWIAQQIYNNIHSAQEA